LTEAAYAAFARIRESFPENPKIICGWSLGAAVAFQAAARYDEEIDGFIALSSWSSLPDVAAEHYPRWMVNFLLKEQYNSLEAARRIHCPDSLPGANYPRGSGFDYSCNPGRKSRCQHGQPAPLDQSTANRAQ
jgi:pimeloyl-ACP methyl ester carboxylesterase